MGIKKIKKHYRIDHIVQRHARGILVGSAYVGDLLVFSDEGALVERSSIGTRDEDLNRYVSEIEANPALFAALLAEDDVFGKSLKVYTWEGADVVECLCEEHGWPNVTHDGRLMYENTHFRSKEKAAAKAKIDAALGVREWARAAAEAERRLAEARGHLGDSRANLAKLDADYPNVEIDESYRRGEEA